MNLTEQLSVERIVGAYRESKASLAGRMHGKYLANTIGEVVCIGLTVACLENAVEKARAQEYLSAIGKVALATIPGSSIGYFHLEGRPPIVKAKKATRA